MIKQIIKINYHKLLTKKKKLKIKFINHHVTNILK